jgi:pterin-4a-carbinolamine dehydratase
MDKERGRLRRAEEWEVGGASAVRAPSASALHPNRRSPKRTREKGCGGRCSSASRSASTTARCSRARRFQRAKVNATFVREIGELAEDEGHHPNISFGWGNATVSLQTKKIKGLHENDFIMATKIDGIFARTAAG